MIKRTLLATLIIASIFSCQALAQQQVYTDNVVIVLDASGSMGGEMGDMKDEPGRTVVKMEAAKAALHHVLQQVPKTTHIGLLVFSGKGISDPWIYPLGPRDDAKLRIAIDRPQPGGGTPLGQYIKIGADRLLQERQKQHGYGSYRLLVVTDGEAGDQNLVERYTPEVIARGITVDVIGVAMASRHSLATKVHSYRRANDRASLVLAISEVFAEVSSKGTDDAAGEEAFQELEGITAEFADGVIKGLSITGNHPIGARPPRIPEQRAAAQQHGRQSDTGGGLPGWAWPFIVIGVVILGVLVRSVRRAARRGW